MSWLRRRFRPGYDDPGAWGTPIEPGDETDEAIRRASADQARRSLQDPFGPLAVTFGAIEQVTRHGSVAPSRDAIINLTRAVLSADYYRARLRPPICGPGGLTDADNRARWERLQPWLAGRLAAVLTANLPGSLVERAVLARLPTTWLPEAPIQRALATGVAAAGWSAPVQVTLSLRAPGGQDAGSRMEATLAAVGQTLAEGGLALLEPVHDPTRPPLAEPLLVVRALGTGADGAVTLICHEADAPENEIRLAVMRSGGDIRLSRQPRAGDRPSLCGLHCWCLQPADPPRFGAARAFRYVFPWWLLWWLRHRL